MITVATVKRAYYLRKICQFTHLCNPLQHSFFNEGNAGEQGYDPWNPRHSKTNCGVIWPIICLASIHLSWQESFAFASFWDTLDGIKSVRIRMFSSLIHGETFRLPNLKAISQLQKSHNAPISYPTKHQFVTEMCTCVHISVTKSRKWCI